MLCVQYIYLAVSSHKRCDLWPLGARGMPGASKSAAPHLAWAFCAPPLYRDDALCCMWCNTYMEVYFILTQCSHLFSACSLVGEQKKTKHTTSVRDVRSRFVWFCSEFAIAKFHVLFGDRSPFQGAHLSCLDNARCGSKWIFRKFSIELRVLSLEIRTYGFGCRVN